jgi:hypothetical protein
LSVFTFIVGVTGSVLHKIPYKIFGKSVNFILTTTIAFLPRSMIPATGSRGILQESHQILQENTGNRWNREAVLRTGITRNRQFPDRVVRPG